VLQQQIDFLRRIPLFEDLDERSVRAIANAVVEQSYERGQDIVREGDTGVGAFIIRSGRAEVLQNRGGEIVRLGELQAGDFFGEMALLDEFPRSATVRAVEPATCLGLTRWHFRGILESHPQIALAILPVLTRRVRSAERAAAEAARH
jgi:CRP/FNR family cyclic AMP-dependent transcriptional regulator